MAKVLIIEDEEGIQALLKRVATMLGHEVLIAGDGATGCQRVDEHRPDLVISDLSLPGSPNGLDLIRILRQKRPDGALVVSTGYTTADNLAQIEAEGVRHILGKPFDMAAVRSLITSLIGDARPKPGA